MGATAPNSFDFEFGQHIARARESVGLSQRRVSEALAEKGITLDSAALSRLEQGKRAPKLEEAVALAEVLNLPLIGLLPPTPDVIRLARARQNVDDAYTSLLDDIRRIVREEVSRAVFGSAPVAEPEISAGVPQFFYAPELANKLARTEPAIRWLWSTGALKSRVVGGRRVSTAVDLAEFFEGGRS